MFALGIWPREKESVTISHSSVCNIQSGGLEDVRGGVYMCFLDVVCFCFFQYLLHIYSLRILMSPVYHQMH